MYSEDFGVEFPPLPWSSVGEMLESAFDRYPDRTAIIDGDTHLSYSDLDRMVQQLAATYMELGLQPGDRVIVWGENSWRWVIVALACFWRGLVVIPLSARMRPAEVETVIESTGPRLVYSSVHEGVDYLLSARAVETVMSPQSDDSSLGLDGILATVQPAGRLAAHRVEDSSQPCEILFTSGSTGEPKGVMLGKNQVLGPNWDSAQIRLVDQDDRLLVIPPFSHNYGLNYALLGHLMRGASLVLMPVFSAQRVIELMQQYGVTVLSGPPALFALVLAESRQHPELVGKLRVASMGGAFVEPDLIRNLTAAGVDIVASGYGLTEFPVAVSMPNTSPAEIKAQTSGIPLPGVQVKLDQDNASEPGSGKGEGEILLKGDSLMLGYWGGAAENQLQVDADGWLHTGDIGRWVDGRYLQIVGRKKEIYIANGFNVYPAEVEGQLMSTGWLSAVAVVSRPNKFLGEEGIAFVVPGPGMSVDQPQLNRWARENLARHKVPARFVIVESLPVNVNGKVDKRALRDSL